MDSGARIRTPCGMDERRHSRSTSSEVPVRLEDAFSTKFKVSSPMSHPTLRIRFRGHGSRFGESFDATRRLCRGTPHYNHSHTPWSSAFYRSMMISSPNTASLNFQSSHGPTMYISLYRQKPTGIGETLVYQLQDPRFEIKRSCDQCGQFFKKSSISASYWSHYLSHTYGLALKIFFVARYIRITE